MLWKWRLRRIRKPRRSRQGRADGAKDHLSRTGGSVDHKDRAGIPGVDHGGAGEAEDQDHYGGEDGAEDQTPTMAEQAEL